MSRPISYYTSLVTSQYQNAPKFLTWLESCLKKFDDASNCIDGLAWKFDLDSAIGSQLDTIGVIVGQARTVGFQPSGGVSPILDDATYRLLLKARIAQNTWDGKISSLQPIWQNLFPGGRINLQDNQNMTITVTLAGNFTSIIQDLISNGYIVPRPEGVLINYLFGTQPFFGCDRNDSYVAGADVGHAA